MFSSSLISGLSSVRVEGLATSDSETSDSDALSFFTASFLVLSFFVPSFFPQDAANTHIARINATVKIFFFLIILLTLFLKKERGKPFIFLSSLPGKNLLGITPHLFIKGQKGFIGIVNIQLRGKLKRCMHGKNRYP